MCKINGHSIFSYLAQPWNTSKLYTSKARAAAVAEAEAEAAKTIAANSDGDEIADTASYAKVNSKKSQTLSSLRVPLESSTVGASVDSSSSLGLNLGC